MEWSILLVAMVWNWRRKQIADRNAKIEEKRQERKQQRSDKRSVITLDNNTHRLEQEKKDKKALKKQKKELEKGVGLSEEQQVELAKQKLMKQLDLVDSVSEVLTPDEEVMAAANVRWIFVEKIRRIMNEES